MKKQKDHAAHVLFLRPHSDVYRQWYIAVAALLIPLIGVTYWLTIPHGTWLPVVIAQAILTALVVGASIAYFRTGIWVSSTDVAERGFFGLTVRVPKTSIGSVNIFEIYQSGSTDVLPQLFVADHYGHLLIRMRGQFWSREQMELIAEHIGAPIDRATCPLSLAELHRARPDLLYWFERPLGSPRPSPHSATDDDGLGERPVA